MYRSTFGISIAAAAAGLLLSACGSGPSEAEYVQACVKSPLATEKSCQCAARESRSSLPAHVYTAIVLDMQGKKQESEAILGKLNFDERAEFGMKQFEIVGKCLAER